MKKQITKKLLGLNAPKAVVIPKANSKLNILFSSYDRAHQDKYHGANLLKNYSMCKKLLYKLNVPKVCKIVFK